LSISQPKPRDTEEEINTKLNAIISKQEEISTKLDKQTKDIEEIKEANKAKPA
jgi:hypothetical protein